MKVGLNEGSLKDTRADKVIHQLVGEAAKSTTVTKYLLALGIYVESLPMSGKLPDCD